MDRNIERIRVIRQLFEDEDTVFDLIPYSKSCKGRRRSVLRAPAAAGFKTLQLLSSMESKDGILELSQALVSAGKGILPGKLRTLRICYL